MSAASPMNERDALAPRAAPAHTTAGHLRATALLLALSIAVSGFAYPIFVTEVSHLIDPYAAGGSLLRYPNGTVAGSTYVAQNLTNASQPWLFWARPSLSDYNTTLGAETPPGPSDPALLALFNETIAYMRLYGNFTVNATLPIWLVAPSGSSIDPDLVPEAVLVQVPRVAANTNLSALGYTTLAERIAYLTAFVTAHIEQPPLPFVGVPYVDVLKLDLALLPRIGR
ncbi:MAG TPA: potassium-transporting ATPase subunit C [Thermoplasmata archaeon]|nr:potassium-transporting ATPase subunit C [Thermoplasmata archaeon]